MRDLADASVCGSHLCQLFADPQERRDVVIPFFKAGLAAGECCILSLGNSRPDEIKSWFVELESAGLDVSSARDAGALINTDDSDWRHYFRDTPSVVRVREAWSSSRRSSGGSQQSESPARWTGQQVFLQMLSSYVTGKRPLTCQSRKRRCGRSAFTISIALPHRKSTQH